MFLALIHIGAAGPPLSVSSRRRVRAALVAQVERRVQLRQPGGLALELGLHGEGLGGLGPGRFQLLAQVGQLGPVPVQVLRQFGQGVVDAGDVAGGAVAQVDGVLDGALERGIMAPEGVQPGGDGKAPVIADFNGLRLRDARDGAHEGLPGLVPFQVVAAVDFHACEAVCRMGMGREGVHIRLEPSDQGLGADDFSRDVCGDVVL